MVSLRVRKESTFACSRCEAVVSFSSSACSCACWVERSAICWLTAARRLSASRAKSSRPAWTACCACAWSLAAEACSCCICSSSRLRLLAPAPPPPRHRDPLAPRRHARHTAAHLRQQLELLLVGVVERLARVLVLVENLVGF